MAALLALTLKEADFPLLSPPIHTHKCRHSTSSNNCNRALCETRGSNYVDSTSEPVRSVVNLLNLSFRINLLT